MFKKLISVITIFAVLIAFTPSVAAEPVTATPTIESILADYHEKALAAQASGDTEVAAYSPRSGDTTLSLEQETVNELTAAGYEAYNVTGDNYDAMAESLHTDLGSMGITDDGSYIVVVTDDYLEQSDDTSAGTYGLTLPPHLRDDGGIGEGFTYWYEGIRYTMRYVTVTASESGFRAANVVDLRDKLTNNQFYDMLESGIKALLYKAVSDSINSLIGENYLTPIMDILQALYENTTFAEDDILLYTAGTNWTVTYTQIYDALTSSWVTCSSAEYVTMFYIINYTFYNSATNRYEQISTEDTYEIDYSEHFNDSAWLKEFAVLSYTCGVMEWCEQDTIDFVEYAYENTSLITHHRPVEEFAELPSLNG